jgi:lipopolysaccharide transport system ATP-binding protein
MSEAVIAVEGLGKRYRIGAKQEVYHTLRESLMAGARQLVTSFRAKSGERSAEEFWALNDVSFQVQPGEVVAIIGRNGAGKSTLLKILSRITEPTAGRAVLRGRVGSLLEVGTGFHLELTGRENIFLSGVILGMRRAEVQRKFDEIVAFAGVEKFLDTPIKRYSSGMQVRLGFAVAAHLEPEILIVDEVLAVGDAEFQKKCLGKMSEVARGGRTVLFVSHNMAAVQSLCSRGILLKEGRVAFSGTAEQAVAQYVEMFSSSSMFVDLKEVTDRQGKGPIRLERFRVLSEQGEVIDACQCGKGITLELHYASEAPLAGRRVALGIVFMRQPGEGLFVCNTEAAGLETGTLPERGVFRCRIDRLPLSPGRYPLWFNCVVDGEFSDSISGAAALNVVEGDFFGTGKMPFAQVSPVLVPHSWSVTGNDANA